MRSTGFGVFSIACSVLVATSCAQNEKDLPPYLELCAGAAGCFIQPPPLVGGPAGETGGGMGNGGAAGSGGSEQPGTVVTVTGGIQLYRDETFSSRAAYAEPVTVSADGPTGNRVSAFYLGNGTFRLDVKRAAENWFLALPEDNEVAAATVMPWDTEKNTQTDVTLVREASIDLIFGLVQAPVERNPNAAHLVLNVLDADGQPVSGVRVAAPAAEVVAYAVALTWSSQLAETSERGQAFIGNVSGATAGQLSEVEVVLSGTVARGLRARVFPGAVTVLTVRP